MSQKIINKVKKLQNTAARAEGNEAETAARIALKLMREHALSQADLDAFDTEEDPLVRYEVHFDGLCLVTSKEVQNWFNKTAGWKRALASAVGGYLGLRTSYREGRPTWAFYGHRSDCLEAVKLYGICAAQIDAECKAYLKAERQRYERTRHLWWDRGIAKTKGASFRETAVAGLLSKFNDLMFESHEEHAEAHALVIDRRKKVSNWVDTTYSFRKGSGAGFGNAGWNAEGYDTGKSLRLRESDGIEERKLLEEG